MSDNWNQPPGSDPADEQPPRPPEPGPGEDRPGPGAGQGGTGARQGAPGSWFDARDEGGPRGGQGGPDDGQPGPGESRSATWWIGENEAKREFQNPAQAEPPANSWFDGGWNPARREHPDQPVPTQNPHYHPTPNQPGPNQPGPGWPGPAQSGPSEGGPSQSGPSQSGPSQSGPSQSGPRPGPNQPGPTQPGHQPPQNQPGPWQSGPTPPPGPSWSQSPQSGLSQSGRSYSGPSQSGRSHPGPSQGGPSQGGPSQGGPSQGGPSQPGPSQAGHAPSAPQAGSSSWAGQSWTLQTGSDTGNSQSEPTQSGSSGSAPHSNWSATGQSESSAWQSSPSQQPPRQQTGPHSEGSYLWGPSGQNQQQSSPWSNALPPQQQSGARHAGSHTGQSGQIGPMGQPVQQAPTWQYPPIPIPQPPGGRRRRKKKLSRGLLIGLVVLAVLVVGSGITLIVRGLGGDDAQAKNTPTPQASESPSPSESPSSSPSPSTPRGPTVDEVVKGSRLYKIGPVAASKCVEPPFAPVTVAAAQQYYNRLLPCLNRTWWLAMKKANLPFRNPKAVAYVGKVPSACGVQRSVRAAYCAVNETIYLPFSVDNRYYKTNPVYARAIMLNTFAHEYGHHIQKLSGILASSMTRQQSMTPNQKLTESRRRELQATCLGAVYLGADAAYIPMSGPLLLNWKFLISHSGDDYARPRVHDHGNRVSNYQWSVTGFNNKKPDSCNTFTAADVRVN